MVLPRKRKASQHGLTIKKNYVVSMNAQTHNILVTRGVSSSLKTRLTKLF